jgi:hypothetical protein
LEEDPNGLKGDTNNQRNPWLEHRNCEKKNSELDESQNRQTKNVDESLPVELKQQRKHDHKIRQQVNDVF